MMPVRFLAERHGGDRTFGAILAALRCTICRGKPAPVYLVAGHHRTKAKGPATCWSMELVAVPG